MNKKHVMILLACLCLVAAGVCICKLILPTPQTQSEDYGPGNEDSTVNITMPVKHDQTAQTQSGEESPSPQQGYTSPVDFDMLRKLNPDIYAWIDIPGTGISYPVVQSATDDSFYLDHDSDKNASANGAIFSEHVYNDTTFDDKVTVLYGHNMKSGAMFGDLQPIYRKSDNLEVYNEIVIYLPHKELHFEIFAAMQYSRMHLLHYYQVEKKSAFELLIDDIYSTRNLNMTLVEELRPEFGDQVVVLSTCLSGNNKYRYLVMGVCKEVD